MSRVVQFPQVTVAVDGAPLPEGSARTLGEVRVCSQLSLPAQCELTFFDASASDTSLEALAPGRSLRVSLRGESVPLFEGEVTVVEHVYGPAREHEVRVRAYDLLHRLRKRRSVRAHVQLTPRDLAREMVSDIGLSVEAAATGPLRHRLIQSDQSDLDLLTSVASACGLYLTLRGNVLHMITMEGAGTTRPLQLGDSLQEIQVEITGEPACRSVDAAGWNALRVETLTGQATRARTGRQVASSVAPEQLGGDGRFAFAGETLQDEQHAEARAQAELDRRIAREVTLRGVAEGDPNLHPGTPVDVSGIADACAGRYVLTAVTHVIDQRRGFVSEISSVPPAPPVRKPYPIAALGLVTRIDDPENAGRVRVSLPAYAGVETEWMQVVSAGAGNGKGLTILPDLDDRVLVLLFEDDLGQGVVLGGLYGMDGPSDSGVEQGAVRRFTFLTPGGQRVRLDDGEETIRLEISRGSYIELSPRLARVHAASDLTLEAPGKKVLIRGQKIDFERA
jgi:phage protein D/phage baseplate assembly protein gpV